MKQHKAVALDYIEAAGQYKELSYRFDEAPAILWQALLDPKAWTEWLPLDEVIWTDPVGTTVGSQRTVKVGKNTIEETFLAWEPGKRLAFRFERSDLPVSAFAEDYIVEPDGETGCRLIWRIRGDAFFLLKPLLYGRLLKSGQAGFPKLAELMAHNRETYQALAG